MLPSLTSISQAFINIRYARDSVNELESIFAELPEVKPTSDARTELNSTEFKTIKFHAIRYAYPNTNGDTLKGISLTIHKGDRIGVIGESGSGKSTLLNIMLGFLDKTSGTIELNGSSIELDTDEWQNQIAVVRKSCSFFRTR